MFGDRIDRVIGKLSDTLMQKVNNCLKAALAFGKGDRLRSRSGRSFRQKNPCVCLRAALESPLIY